MSDLYEIYTWIDGAPVWHAEVTGDELDDAISYWGSAGRGPVDIRRCDVLQPDKELRELMRHAYFVQGRIYEQERIEAQLRHARSLGGRR